MDEEKQQATDQSLCMSAKIKRTVASKLPVKSGDVKNEII
jgi:hypothetical protein